jgi:predicted DNA-binding protein
MPKFSKKVQVLLTEDQYKAMGEISSKRKRKVSFLVREAIEEYYLKAKKKKEIAEAVDRLLSLPPVPAPESWEEFEKELARVHGFHE